MPRSFGDPMIGIDIVDIPRFTRLLCGSTGERLKARIFLDEELAQCLNASGKIKMESLAARFAAKEAVIKASRGRLDISDLRSIRIIQDAAGWLEAEAGGADGSATRFEISISHDGNAAVAVALART